MRRDAQSSSRTSPQSIQSTLHTRRNTLNNPVTSNEPEGINIFKYYVQNYCADNSVKFSTASQCEIWGRWWRRARGDGHAEDRAHARRTRKHVERKLGSWEPGAVLSTPSQYLISISRNTLNLISIPEPPSFAHPKP